MQRFYAAIMCVMIVMLFTMKVNANDLVAPQVYSCDYKVLSLNTNIVISTNGDEIGSISGKVFRLVTDPLVFKDTHDEVIAQASDNYNFINQDDHAIVIGDTVTAIMRGKFAFAGQKYDLEDADGNLLGTAAFNWLDTKGTIKDADGNICATYTSSPLFHDYEVEITSDKFDEKTILLIVASYVSDKEADNAAKSTSSSSHSNN